MNFKILVLTTALPAILLLFAIKNTYYNKPNTSEHRTDKCFKIAILTPATHPSLQKIEAGFCKILNGSTNARYEFLVFNANGDKILLRSQAEAVVNKDFDLIFTIATAPTQIIKELCTKKGKNIPIIFGAVADPVKLGIVKSISKPGGFVTGTIESSDYKTQLDLLLRLKPGIKSILLPYNPTQGSGLERDKNEIVQLLSKKNISIVPCEAYNINEIQGKIAGLVQNVDAVLILKDNTMVSGIDAIIKQCNLCHKVLMATDLDSGIKGAALSFGVKEAAFGEQAAFLAQQILENKVLPTNLPCITSYKNRLKINTKTMHAQGLLISNDMLNLIEYARTI